MKYKLNETERKIQNSQKERVIRIPATVFERKKVAQKSLTLSVLNSISMENPSSKNTSKKGQDNSKNFTIRYKDSIVPDEVYYSETFQKIKRESVLQNMNMVIHKFFKKKALDDRRELICRWLCSLEGLHNFPMTLMSHLMDYMKLEKYEDRYRRSFCNL